MDYEKKTIEEKAKAYDEATKKVKDYYEGKTKIYSDVDKTLNYLFPELKESKDERIRKELVDYLTNELEGKSQLTPYTHQFKAWIAWLEKQSEEARNIALRTEYEKGRADAIAEMQKPAWNPEYLIELADKYYDDVLIGQCKMDEKTAHHCRLAYLQGLQNYIN